MTTVDWTRPIEAVHEDGRVRPVVLITSPSYTRAASVAWADRACPPRIVNDDGTFRHETGWTIRNTPAPEREDRSDTATLPSALVERMVAFITRCAAWDGSFALASDLTEARAIVAETEPVDEDLAFARAFLGDVAENVQAFSADDMPASYRNERTDFPTQFTRRLADKLKAVRDEGRSPLVAELPEVVDGDLVIARQAVAEMPLFADVADEVLAGGYDDSAIVRATVDAVRDQFEREGR